MADTSQQKAKEQQQTLADSLIETPDDPRRFRFRPFLLYPFLVVIVAFVLDKQLFLWRFPDYFLTTISYLSYEHKELMTDQLEQYLRLPEDQRQKVVVLFGNSRTSSFDNNYIAQNHPDWILFNYSVPGGTPDYYYYYLTEFDRRGIKPEFVIFTIAAQGTNATPSIAMDEVMLEGLPVSFVVQNFHHYSVDELSNYAAKQLFWIYQYRPKLGRILKRMENDSRTVYELRLFKASKIQEMFTNRGSAPFDAGNQIEQDQEFLRRSAEGTFRDFLRPFTIDEGQLYFTEEMIAAANAQGIPSALLWARVGPNLRKIIGERDLFPDDDARSETIRSIWEPEILEIAERQNVPVWDMNFEDPIECDVFYDSSHMASYCFPEFTDYIFARMTSRLNQ